MEPAIIASGSRSDPGDLMELAEFWCAEFARTAQEPET
jgi:hypothetical protein